MPPRTGFSGRSLATILFTDIVGSTHRATELGDRAWRKLLEAHDAQVRRALRRLGGREVNTAGDGFLALFERPVRAIACARAAWRDADPALRPWAETARQAVIRLSGPRRG